MTQKRRTQQVTEEVAVAVECDHCGKVEAVDNPTAHSTVEPDGWTHFSSHHSDWGNDSVESYEKHDACSWACYLAIVRRVVDDTPGSDTLVVDGRGMTFLRDMLGSTGHPS